MNHCYTMHHLMRRRCRSITYRLRASCPVESFSDLICPSFHGLRRLCSSKEDERKKRRDFLVDELTKRIRRGPFHEDSILKAPGHGAFTTSENLTPKAKSPIIVKGQMKFQTLAKTIVEVPHPAKPTVLLIGFNNASFDMLRSWRSPIEREYTDLFHPDLPFQLLEVSVVENWVYQYLKGVLTSALKRKIDFERHAQVAPYFGSFEKWKQIFGIKNTMLAYVFLVDRGGRIRWKASGKASLNGAVSIVENMEKIIEENETI